MTISARAGTSRSDVSHSTSSSGSPSSPPASSYSPPIPGIRETAPMTAAGWWPIAIATEHRLVQLLVGLLDVPAVVAADEPDASSSRLKIWWR
jgi:hypothetical protein